MKIYTLGYSGWKFDDVVAVLDRLDAHLVDVRLVPRSRNPDFNGNSLVRHTSGRYVWVRQLGNVNYKLEAPIKLVDFEAGAAAVKAVADSGKAIILLCGCKDVASCHRSHVAQRLAELWNAEVEHLSAPVVVKPPQSSEPTLF